MNDTFTETPTAVAETPAAAAETAKRDTQPVVDYDLPEIGVPRNNPLAIFANSILDTHVRPAIRQAIEDCGQRRVSPSIPNLVVALNARYHSRIAEGAVRKWLKATGFAVRTQSCVIETPAPAAQEPVDSPAVQA